MGGEGGEVSRCGEYPGVAGDSAEQGRVVVVRHPPQPGPASQSLLGRSDLAGAGHRSVGRARHAEVLPEHGRQLVQAPAAVVGQGQAEEDEAAVDVAVTGSRVGDQVFGADQLGQRLCAVPVLVEAGVGPQA